MRGRWQRALGATILAGGLIGLTAPEARAQPLVPMLVAQAVPQIDTFSAEPVNDLSPGTELIFTVEGSPGSKATISIAGVTTKLPMREIESGTYEARYTIKRRDKITGTTAIRATLRKGKRTATARLSAPLLDTAQSGSPSGSGGGNTTVSIDRFAIDPPVDRLEPGTELVFKLNGTPQARASFTIAGVVTNQAMSEVSPGAYEGRYTIRRNDNFPPGVAITATLESQGQTARYRLQQGLINDDQPPTVQNPSPANNGVASSLRPLISAVFDDGRGSGVDPKSVRIRFDGQDVTSDATITANFFNYQPPRNLAQGTYRVEVDLKDLSGNPGGSNWQFQINRQAAVPQPQQLLLQVTSPANNSQVPAGAVTVRGKSSPGATIAVNVQATTSLVGLFGVNQQVLDQTIQADAQGNFSFQFRSPISAAGTRYEINLTANKNGQSRQQKLILIQQ